MEVDGYIELVGKHKRYRLVDASSVLCSLAYKSTEDFQSGYRNLIQIAVDACSFQRDPMGSEFIAVGSEAFSKTLGPRIPNRPSVALIQDECDDSTWMVKESSPAYGDF